MKNNFESVEETFFHRAFRPGLGSNPIGIWDFFSGPKAVGA